MRCRRSWYFSRKRTARDHGYKTYGETFPTDFAAAGINDKIVLLIVYDKNFIDVDKTIAFCENRVYEQFLE